MHNRWVPVSSLGPEAGPLHPQLRGQSHSCPPYRVLADLRTITSMTRWSWAHQLGGHPGLSPGHLSPGLCASPQRLSIPGIFLGAGKCEGRSH